MYRCSANQNLKETTKNYHFDSQILSKEKEKQHQLLLDHCAEMSKLSSLQNLPWMDIHFSVIANKLDTRRNNK